MQKIQQSKLTLLSSSHVTQNWALSTVTALSSQQSDHRSTLQNQLGHNQTEALGNIDTEEHCETGSKWKLLDPKKSAGRKG